MSEADLNALVAKHRSTGVVVDTNLLLVYFVGLCGRNVLQAFKRTQNFTYSEFLLLAGFLEKFTRIITTPNILTEVNSLANQLHEANKAPFFGFFKQRIQLMSERYQPSRDVSNHRYFEKCGLTDSTIMAIAEKKLLVITVDFKLTGFLESLGTECLNFNHMRYLARQA